MISPLLSNIYLNEVDKMFEQAKEVTRYGKWTAIEYARFADDLVILVDSHPRQRWLRKAVEKRLREELAKVLVEVNDEKTRLVDLKKGESFGFLGFDFRRIRSRAGKWAPLLLPKGKKRTALLRKLKGMFPTLSISASRKADQNGQPDFAWLGELLPSREFGSLFLVPIMVGRKEDPAPSCKGVPASRLRLEAVE